MTFALPKFFVLVVPDEPFEYWCASCKQLRLCCDPVRITCGNCGAPITERAQPGTLDAKKLRAGEP